MSISNTVIAFCSNNENDAKNMALKLNTISSDITFLTAIAKAPKIDYFIIEDSFKECLAKSSMFF
ncbi:MAG: hypothetical protein H7336_03325 [Bacteriovorax sp.]|nr:hypothetical protein [Bacteriovorax sp.]